MSHIIKRKVNNNIYVYEETSYRNKDGKPRTKQKYLGKLDNNGVLISSKSLGNIPAEIKEVKVIKRKFRVVPLDNKKDN